MDYRKPNVDVAAVEHWLYIYIIRVATFTDTYQISRMTMVVMVDMIRIIMIALVLNW